MNYIDEAERVERNGAAPQESGEQISAALDAIARDYFARAINRSKK
jgi:hypothetical protein